MKEYSFADLGQLVGLLVKGGHYQEAQQYLSEMQDRLNMATGKAEKMQELGETLEQLPMTIAESKLEHKSAQAMSDDVRLDYCELDMEPEQRGPLRDSGGNVTRVSVLAEERGYDPDAHENKNLKIFCDGTHIPTAHTADTVEGLVRYYKKDERGRVKTLEKRGKVEIHGL